MIRWERLDPKTAVAHSAVTAKMEPTRAEPTGTVTRPTPRWMARRTPMSVLGEAPSSVKNADRPGRVLASVSVADSAALAAVRAGRTPRAKKTAKNSETSDEEYPRIEGKPVRRFGNSRHADWHEARQTVRQDETSDDAGDAGRCSPGHSRHEELSARHPQRAERAVRLLLDQRLTTLGLRQHDQPNQRGQGGQDPPAHRLRSDGRRDGGRIGVEVSDAQSAVLAGLGLEARRSAAPCRSRTKSEWKKTVLSLMERMNASVVKRL